jgi:CARDB
MADRDDDFEFDFFEDEPSTQETAVGGRVLRRPGGGPPKPPMRPPSGITPILRLVGLIAFAIVAVVVLVFVVKGCRDKGQEGAYRSYMDNVSQVASESQTLGRQLNTLLTTPGTEQAELEQKLSGLAQQQNQLVATAQGFDPPGPLSAEQDAVVEALELRVSGIKGLEDVFRQTADSDDADEAGRLLSAQAQRLVASDVIWDDRFRTPARAELAAQDITGVQVPDSNFLITPEVASSATLKPIWQRLHGAQTGGTPQGLHGNGIVKTVVLPSEQELSRDTETTIDASTDLAFDVTVENSGDFAETSVEVTLTIQKSPPIVKKQTISVINPGEQKTVKFEDIGQPPFVQPTKVKVDVKPVPGEQNEANNVAEYPVIFSLG